MNQQMSNSPNYHADNANNNPPWLNAFDNQHETLSVRQPSPMPAATQPAFHSPVNVVSRPSPPPVSPARPAITPPQYAQHQKAVTVATAGTKWIHYMTTILYVFIGILIFGSVAVGVASDLPAEKSLLVIAATALIGSLLVGMNFVFLNMAKNIATLTEWALSQKKEN